MDTTPLLAAEHIEKRFERRLDLAERLAAKLGAAPGNETVHALDGVSLAVTRGEVLGIVGESGCGKSTLGRILADIMPASSGRVLWQGTDRDHLTGSERRAVKLAVQMVFQDPASSLNPRQRVADIVGEAPLVHGQVTRAELSDHVDAVLRDVGLDPAMKQRYPHQFSGGQRQRIGIARALAVGPQCIIADEAVAALDVSIRAQIINLLDELRRKRGLTYLFISHDLGIVRFIADRVVVMYLGRVVENAPAGELFARPHHPYTIALLAGAPRLDDRKRAFAAIDGEIPSPLNPPRGCHFHPRCPHVMARCREEAPRLSAIAPGRLSACHLAET